MLELNTRKGFDKLLHNSSKRNKSYLLQSNCSINMLNDDPRIYLHPKSSNFNLYGRDESYDQSLILNFVTRQGNLSLKNKKMLVPLGSYNTSPVPPPWWVDELLKERSQFLVSTENISLQWRSSHKGSYSPEGNWYNKSDYVFRSNNSSNSLSCEICRATRPEIDGIDKRYFKGSDQVWLNELGSNDESFMLQQ